MPGEPVPAEVDPPTGYFLITRHAVSRKALTIVGAAMGVGFGLVNAALPGDDFTLRPALLAWTLGAIAVIILLHEGIHGAAGLLPGHRPVFGVKPPFVFTTFRHKIPRADFVLVALAPLVVLDAAAAVLYATGDLTLFYVLCFEINTIGAIGDLWIALKLLPAPRGSLVQDTMTGIEIWRPPDHA